MHLREVHIYFLATVDTNRRTSVNDWQSELSRHSAIYAALVSSGIDKSLDARHAWNWRGIPIRSVVWVESDVDPEGRSTRDEFARALLVPAVNAGHLADGTPPMSEESSVVRRPAG